MPKFYQSLSCLSNPLSFQNVAFHGTEFPCGHKKFNCKVRFLLLSKMEYHRRLRLSGLLRDTKRLAFDLKQSSG